VSSLVHPPVGTARTISDGEYELFIPKAFAELDAPKVQYFQPLDIKALLETLCARVQR
jgi:hypothetical protein